MDTNQGRVVLLHTWEGDVEVRDPHLRVSSWYFQEVLPHSDKALAVGGRRVQRLVAGRRT